MRRETFRRLEPLISIPLFVAALWVIHRELAQYGWRDAEAAVAALPSWRIAAAVGLTVVNFLVLTGYDTLALRFVGHPLAYRRSAFASFLGYAFSNALGFPLLTGAPLRFRLYSGWGLSAVEIRNLVAFYTGTFWLGFITLGGIVFLFDPLHLTQLLHLPVWAGRVLAVILLVISAGYTTVTALRRRPLRIRGIEIPLPRPAIALGQTLVASLDWAINASVLYVLLPRGHGVTFAAFVAVYLLGQIVGVLSHVPGGLGVFEAVVISLLPATLPEGAVLGSLLVFRAIYYLLPLLVAALLLGAYEVQRRRAELVRAGALVGRTSTAIGRTASSVVPAVLSVTTFAAGLVLLLSGATPAAAGRLRLVSHLLPLPVIEVSHFVGSVVGAAILILAWGLQRRLDAAWYLALAMLVLGATVSLLKGLDYEEATFLLVMAVALAASRGEFHRKASLLSERFSPAWVVAVAVALLSSVGLALFAYKHVGYSSDLWWRFALRAQAPRALRAEVGALGVVLAFAALRLFRPARPVPRVQSGAELERAAAIVARSPVAASHLALLGDKRLLFSPSGDTFIMYAVEGRSWVAMGDPVGPVHEHEDLVWAFREIADEHGGWPVFYQVRPESLPLYIDLGLTFVKLGEEARVPLATFALAGGAMKTLRQQVCRVERHGVSFEIVPAAAVPALLPQLRQVSDEWLGEKRTREKGFSLGFFSAEYLSRLPVAVARRGERIEAFANVWPGGGTEELSVDLMRYRPDAPAGIMDFLLVQLMLWGRTERYQWFNLGMTPLAGIEFRPLAPLWSRVGASVHRMGEHFYNFEGVRSYKSKFHPVWEPRYLASPGGLVLPRILTNVATLIGGGIRGTLAR